MSTLPPLPPSQGRAACLGVTCQKSTEPRPPALEKHLLHCRYRITTCESTAFLAQRGGGTERRYRSTLSSSRYENAFEKGHELPKGTQEQPQAPRQAPSQATRA